MHPEGAEHPKARAPEGTCTQRCVHTEVQVAFGGAREPFAKGHPSVDPLMPCLADPMCAQRHGWGGTMHTEVLYTEVRAHRGAGTRRCQWEGRMDGSVWLGGSM